MIIIHLNTLYLIGFSMLTVAAKYLQDFTVHVGNTSNINDHNDICAYHSGTIPASGTAVLPCDGVKVARYLSVINSKKHEDYYYFFLCEVVIIGAVAAGTYTMFVVITISYKTMFCSTLIHIVIV